MSSKDKWNARNYDCVSIRFPKGTKTKFKKLFPGVPFNSYVVNLLIFHLLIAEKNDDSYIDNNEIL